MGDKGGDEAEGDVDHDGADKDALPAQSGREAAEDGEDARLEEPGVGYVEPPDGEGILLALRPLGHLGGRREPHALGRLAKDAADAADAPCQRGHDGVAAQGDGDEEVLDLEVGDADDFPPRYESDEDDCCSHAVLGQHFHAGIVAALDVAHGSWLMVRQVCIIEARMACSVHRPMNERLSMSL